MADRVAILGIFCVLFALQVVANEFPTKSNFAEFLANAQQIQDNLKDWLNQQRNVFHRVATHIWSNQPEYRLANHNSHDTWKAIMNEIMDEDSRHAQNLLEQATKMLNGEAEKIPYEKPVSPDVLAFVQKYDTCMANLKNGVDLVVEDFNRDIANNERQGTPNDFFYLLQMRKRLYSVGLISFINSFAKSVECTTGTLPPALRPQTGIPAAAISSEEKELVLTNYRNLLQKIGHERDVFEKLKYNDKRVMVALFDRMNAELDREKAPRSMEQLKPLVESWWADANNAFKFNQDIDQGNLDIDNQHEANALDRYNRMMLCTETEFRKIPIPDRNFMSLVTAANSEFIRNKSKDRNDAWKDVVYTILFNRLIVFDGLARKANWLDAKAVCFEQEERKLLEERGIQLTKTDSSLNSS